MTETTVKRDIDGDILAIREMLAQEQTPPLVSRRAEWGEPIQRPQDLPGPEELAAMTAAAQSRRAARAARMEDLPVLPAEDASADTTRPARGRGKKRRQLPAAARIALPGLERLRGYRPSRRQVMLLVLVLFALWRPWLVLALVLLPPVLVLGLLVGLGHDRFWDGAMRGFIRFAQRFPARAERLRRRMDGFAMRWDAVLDRFPEALVQGLYLPDFDSLQQREARHDRVLDERLARLRNEAGAQ